MTTVLVPWMRDMTDLPFANTYNLSQQQLVDLDAAEELMEASDLTGAETKLLEMLEADSKCIPVLNNLGHLYGKHFSEFEKAVVYYQKVLDLEPDNAWARDQRRKFQRYCTYD
ncbi:MAG: tetratricopeptide repeat protein [Candidatus Poseidoniaceae archaeon]|jgi:Tfp pilus assembly protein PilF|nr:tetratricopeptide repeat protein [Candidatus Poseidoniaceae archaeon]